MRHFAISLFAAGNIGISLGGCQKIYTHTHTNIHDLKQLSSGSGPDINDVPAGFNNYLFIEGVILQCREPDEGVWGILTY